MAKDTGQIRVRCEWNMTEQRRKFGGDDLIAAILLLLVLLGGRSCLAQCTEASYPIQGAGVSTLTVPGDRWMEIDLYWFDQKDIPGSVKCFWDRFAPLYRDVRGDRGLILNVGWTVGYIMEWSGDLQQRIALPAGTGEQPWVKEDSPLAGTTEQRKLAWKERFASSTVVTHAGYGPWSYQDLRLLTDTLRSEGAKRQIAGFKVGSLVYAWNDAYGEVAPWAKRHPEAFSTWAFTRDGQHASGNYFDPAATLHQDSARLGGLLHGIAEGTPVHTAFAAQWGSLSRATGLEAIMLRDSFGMPVPYQRAGPDGLLEPSAEMARKHIEATAALVRETKRSNPGALVMMYSNAATAYGDWRCNGFDLEKIAREGYLDVWVDQTWAGAWNEVGVRHNSFWNDPVLGWTYQLTYTLTHAAMLAGTRVKHYPLVETFDAWESWDVLHTVPQRLRWGIWAYSHASVKTPQGIKVPDGSYISWANQGKRLLSADDVTFLNANISQAVIDAHNVKDVYGPTLVYSRTAAQWQVDHATADRDAKEWLDQQIGSVIKWPVPVLSSTRIEWLPLVHSDAFLLGGLSHLTPRESSFVHAAAKAGAPIVLVGTPAGGFDASLTDLIGLHASQAQPAPLAIIKGTDTDFAASLAAGIPHQFPIRQAVSSNTTSEQTRAVYAAGESPALTVQRAPGADIVTWDPPDFAVEWDTKLLDIWGGSAAPYVLTAGAINAALSRAGALHAWQIDLQQTMNLTAWRTKDSRIHLMFGNLEEGLRDDGDATRRTSIALPQNWNSLHWQPIWSDAEIHRQDGRLTVQVGQAGSIHLVSNEEGGTVH